MRFKILSTEIYISFIFMIVLTLLLAIDKTGFLVPVFFSVTMHEFAHLFVMWLLNCEPKQIRLIPGSIQIIRKFTYKRNGEILISLSGPLMNLVLFSVFLINYYSFGSKISLDCAAINLILAVFNLLPVRGLDGGTILYYILLKLKNGSRANSVINLLTVVIALITIIFGIILLTKGRMNYSLIILGIYFLLSLSFKI